MSTEIQADTAADVWQVGAREGWHLGQGGGTTPGPVAASAAGVLTELMAGEGDGMRKGDARAAIG